MTVQVLHYGKFTIADEGYPRGACATFKRADGSTVVLTAEPDECIEDQIDAWWVDHGQDEVAASGEAHSYALEHMPELV